MMARHEIDPYKYIQNHHFLLLVMCLCLHVFMCSSDLVQSLWDVGRDPTQFPVSLGTGESHSFVFSLQPLGLPPKEGGRAEAKYSCHSVLSLTWTAPSLLSGGQVLTGQYSLGPVLTEPTELAISVTVPDVVYRYCLTL